MDAVPPDVFTMVEKRLDWIGRRQSVLAQNVANANTPGYTAHDLKPFSDYLSAEAEQANDDGFMTVSTGLELPRDLEASEVTLDGNSVELDVQLEKIAAMDTAHQLATNLYKKYEGLFKMVIGKS
jgi:flagellar basal-body rod protein FlgB